MRLGATAREHRLPLITCDRIAEPTYRALGVTYEVLSPINRPRCLSLQFWIMAQDLSAGAGASMAVKRLSAWTMTREALTVGLDAGEGFLGRTRGNDITTFRCGGRRFVVVSHPDHVDHVLHAARLKYVKSNEYEPIRAGAGISVLTDEGDSWAAHRGALNPTFARRHLNSLVELMMDPIVDMDRRLIAQGDGNEFDMHDVMVDVTLRVLANALFSQDVGPLVDTVNDLIAEGMRKHEKLARLALWGLLPRRVYDGMIKVVRSKVRLPPPARGIQNIVKSLDRAVDEVVDGRINQPTDDNDLLNALFRADGGTWPRQRVRDEAMTFMLAGHETAAVAMSWFWYLLALNEDARNKMLDEVDTVLGDRRPCADDLSKLPWTTASVLETLRFYAPVWLLGREAIEDDVIAGHPIRPGTTVMIPAHHIHHDSRWWPDPERFDPNRFVPSSGSPDEGAVNARHRSAYIPFGGGRRVCVGQSFAAMEMVLIAATLSQRHTFDLKPGHPVELEAAITLRPKHGIRVIARRRRIQ